MGPTFAEQDRIAAAREEKRRECVERLAQILSKEFDYQELALSGPTMQSESRRGSKRVSERRSRR